MTDICQAIYAFLSENEQIRECVGNKIFPIMLPEDAPLPAIVYSPVLANYDSALQGDFKTFTEICAAWKSKPFSLKRTTSTTGTPH